ncbi:MAG: hypothetical protein E7621_02640 [Ruminococcaceae bacterium]|nr:hypothetical protein [Oscillospiraceae bacterium]
MNKNTQIDTKKQPSLFPLGGMGTDCITFAENGIIKTPYIFNKDKASGSISFFAVKAEKDGVFEDARLVCSENISEIDEYIPHFTNTEIHSRFPYIEKSFSCESFPGKVKLTAFNPFIPFNDSDSSIPAAFFEFEIENTADRNIDYTICGVFENPFENGKNTFDGDIHTESKGIRMYSLEDIADDGSLDSTVNAKNLYISTDFEDVSYQEYLKNGSFTDKMTAFCDDFIKNPSFKNRSYKDCGFCNSGLIAAHLNLNPSEKKKVRFVISWYMRYISENDKNLSDDKNRNFKRNYYCRYFSNSTECAAYCYTHWERLKKETDLFSDTLYSSTLEPEILECITSNLWVLKSPFNMRDKDGNIINYKNGNEGCIYNYEYAICHLFPKIARSMRKIEFLVCMNENGALSPVTPYPLSTKPSDFTPFVDTQLGSIIKAYREFKLSGDTNWLKKIWPYAKHCLDFAFLKNMWDSDRLGILAGSQNTASGVLSSPNAYTQGLYAAALLCAADMASILKEKDIANEYASIANKAVQYLNTSLLNDRPCLLREDTADFSFIGQWHGNNLGLSKIFEEEKLLTALDTICDKAFCGNRKAELFGYEYPYIYLLLQNGRIDSALELLRKTNNLNKNGNYDTKLLSSYTLINAATGLSYDMYKESISFDPILSFSQKGYFNCFFAAGEAFGTIEIGPRYIEMKLLSGQFKLRRFGLFKEPKVVYYGGRKFDFKADGNTAVFDVSLICNKEKSIQVIFD